MGAHDSDRSAPGAPQAPTPIGTPSDIPIYGAYRHASVLVYGAKDLATDVTVTVRLLDKNKKEVWCKEVILKAGDGDLQAFRIGEGKTKKLRQGGKLKISTTAAAITHYNEIDRIDLNTGRFTTTLSLIVPDALITASQSKGIRGSGTFTTPVGVTIVLVPREINE
jgi:hypothetical protein